MLAAAAQGVVFAVVLAGTMILRPFGDMFSWIDLYLREGPRAHFLGYFWPPHNEHHLVLIRLLTALDVPVFHVSGVPFVISATLALSVSAAMIFRELRLVHAWPLALLGPMLLLTTPAAVDCAIPINSVYPLTLVFLIAALVLFDAETERTPWTGIRRSAACVAAVLATLANGVGRVALPVLIWTAWRGGAFKWSVAIAVAGICYGLFYFLTLPNTAIDHPDQVFGIGHVPKMLTYLLLYLGLPLSRVPGLEIPAAILGGLLFLSGALVLLRDAVSPLPVTRERRIAVGLVIMALAAAVIAAVGRADVESDVKIPVRYALLAAPLHIGLLMLASRFLMRHAAVLGFAAGLSVALLILQLAGAHSAIAAAIEATIERFNRDPNRSGLDIVVYPDPAMADRVLAAIRRMR